MKNLHKAALKRAYRTLAQGLGGSTVSTGLTALVAALAGAGDDTPKFALIAAAAAVGTTIVAAFTSFWQGVALGLPEAEPENPDKEVAQLRD